MEKKKIDLSIIILSYNSQTDLEQLLPSVFDSEGVFFHPALTPPLKGGETTEVDAFFPSPRGGGYGRGDSYTAEVIVVDNGSTDGTLDLLQTTHYPLLTIVNTNTGFAHGNNLGIRQAKGDYILLLNPDTKLEKNTLRLMLEFMESHHDVGIAGCKLLKADGSLDLACRRRFPNLKNAFFRLFLGNNRNYNYTEISEDQSMEVDSVVGAFLLIRKSVIEKIGLLDENFFMYGEDLDWCWRCKASGKKVWYYPKAIAYHYKGSSSAKVSFKALGWFYDAMWIFYKKHYLTQSNWVLGGLVWTAIKIRYLMAISINWFRKEKFVSK
jgi:GT2 family glycosyltransferase